MARRLVQDVVPGERRSIRNIPLPASKTEPVAKAKKKAEDEAEAQTPQPSRAGRGGGGSTANSKSKAKGGFPRWAMWAIGVVAVCGIIYGASFFFVSASVSVIPKEASASADTAGSAFLEATDGRLSYKMVSLSREAGKEVPASGEEKVERKASGKVVIYNDFSSTAQTLVANTRFETPAGLIFRITAPVSVPGQKTVNGVTTPGSIAVTVTADAPGEKYNVGLSDFTIPGFKGDPKFGKITAKSDPKSPISGGLVGIVKKVAAADVTAAKTAIETGLKTELRDAIRSQIPESHVMFETGSTFAFEELAQAPGKTANSATIREKGTMYGILFDRAELSEYLASRLIQSSNKDVSVRNFDELTFTLDNLATYSPTTAKEIAFKIKGDVDFVWNIHGAAIAEALKGQKRAKIEGILSNFESVKKANIVIIPPWSLSLPDDSSKIEVKVSQGS